jgi:hypothetical protein
MAGPTTTSGHNPSRLGIAPRYLAFVALGALLALGLLGATLTLLHASGNLPAPAIANSQCIDEKLAFLRDQRPADSNLLVIGSSVAWRHFDGAVAIRAAPQTRPLNAGICGLNAQQAVTVADWLLPHLPSVTRVLMIAAPQDFAQCASAPPAFDVADADRYVFERAPKWSFYLRYFDPISLVRNAVQVAAKRANRIPLDPLVFTPYGDGPLDTDTSRDLTYGAIASLDDACFDAVHAFASRMRDTHREFAVATTPLNPEWISRYDASRRVELQFVTTLDHALAGTEASLWNADRQTHFGAAAFTDAIHLRWSAAHAFSEQLVEGIAEPHRRRL